jgi:excisionase family DNA binding protein
MEDYVLIPVAANEIGVSRQTLWRYVNAGRLPAEKIGRDFVIRREDLEAFKAARKPAGRPRKQAPPADRP